jgi:uncharacterized membrane protein HdeD (DUF308 family)
MTFLISVLARLSLLAAGILLLANQFVERGTHAWLSFFPLALAGFGYALLQIQLKPPRRTLLKRLLLALAFILWAIDQLLPEGRVAVFIGDCVIAAYVVDLFWMIRDQSEA